jgi:hypothetical protein
MQAARKMVTIVIIVFAVVSMQGCSTIGCWLFDGWVSRQGGSGC